MYQSIFKTAWGYGTVLATEAGICKIDLPTVNPVTISGSKDNIHQSSPLTEQVVDMLRIYFLGQKQAFEAVPVDLGSVTQFRAEILSFIRSIPYGETRSYGQVSLMAGSPGAARAVGGAMASNPIPVIVPCHRVIAADGRLTGFTAPGGLVLKKILLQAEGIEFKGERVLVGN